MFNFQQLMWSRQKCNVMKVGKHHNDPREWPLGELTIKETETYKYLGDLISKDGRNTKNIDQRKAKIFTTTTAINSIAVTEILRNLETAVLLEPHEKVSVTALLTNSESWNLNIGDRTDRDPSLKTPLRPSVKNPDPRHSLHAGSPVYKPKT